MNVSKPLLSQTFKFPLGRYTWIVSALTWVTPRRLISTSIKKICNFFIFVKFLFLYEAKLSDFYNSDLNEILKDLKTNFQNLNTSLIPLTFDVIEYINKAQKQNIFIEKIANL